jgi:hypothetical protein
MEAALKLTSVTERPCVATGTSADSRSSAATTIQTSRLAHSYIIEVKLLLLLYYNLAVAVIERFKLTCLAKVPTIQTSCTTGTFTSAWCCAPSTILARWVTDSYKINMFSKLMPRLCIFK